MGVVNNTLSMETVMESMSTCVDVGETKTWLSRKAWGEYTMYQYTCVVRYVI
jgi:hypothetical protein